MRPGTQLLCILIFWGACLLYMARPTQPFTGFTWPAIKAAELAVCK